MRTPISFAVLACVGLLFTRPGNAGQVVSPSLGSSPVANMTAGLEETPASRRIGAANTQIQLNPKKVQAFNDLAIAYLQRARETANPKFYDEAAGAISRGFAIESNNYSLQKTQIALLLARHRYAEARESAAQLYRRTPDDVILNGYLAEAEIAVDDYAEAEKAAQRMLNMRPNNVPGLMLGAQLRVLYGDPVGALDLLNLVYTETSPVEVEELAWVGNRIAAIEIDAGKIDAAQAMLVRCEQVFPHYVYTAENLGRVRLAQQRPREAVTLFEQAAQTDPDPHVVYQLAEAETAAGRPDEARATYARFAQLAESSALKGDDASRDLILMESSDPATASAALKLAQSVVDTRHDVWTLDAYAWALYANGKYAEADAAIQKALTVGIQSAQIYDHAGHIAQRLHHDTDAARFFTSSLQADPSSMFASDAAANAGPVAHLPAGSSAQKMMTVLDEVSPPADTSRAATAPASPDATAGLIAFAPVPDALLTPRATDTDRLIRNAQSKAARNEHDATAFATLGAEYFQRARETGNVDDYQLAERSLTASLDQVSADFSADAAFATMAEVCMGEHRFADALTYSQKALALGSGDVSPFAIVGDAYADMGEYDKAKAAYARLTPREMTLSPRAAYARDSRLSYLKFIAGDTAGAIALMKTSVAEGMEAKLPAENLAWLYYELGEYFTQAGDAASADKAYVAALTTHPGDYRALAGLGKLRANRGSYAEAIVLYQRAIAVVPMPLFVAELGDLYTRAGRPAEAKKQYQLVEYIGLLGSINQVLHNRDLALFYADHDTKLPEALTLAQKEFEVRHDVYTWDALAWAQYKNGNLAEAAKASHQALQFGTKDSLLLFHAGMIADRLGERDEARGDLKQALEINPHFHLLYAEAAQQKLSSMNAGASSVSGDVKAGSTTAGALSAGDTAHVR